MNTAIFETVMAELRSQTPEATVAHGILVLPIESRGLVQVVETLKGVAGFDMLLDVTAIDWPARDPRFDVVWHFYSTTHKVRVRVRTQVTEADPTVRTLTPYYGSAAFAERECHEMYGIRFEGNADLRPILLYEGFAGHPLRKDYPIGREQPLVRYRS